MIIKKINNQDYSLSKVQDYIDEAFRLLFKKNPILSTVQLSQNIQTTDTIIEHKLGREVQGFIPIKLDAGAVIYLSQTSNSRPKDQIILKASQAVYATLLIF
jgi:hypothetical protein